MNMVHHYKLWLASALLCLLNFAHAANYTAVTNGDWTSPLTWGGTAPPNNVSLDQITIPAGIAVTLDANVNINGIIASLDVNGSLSGNNNYILTITQGTFAGSGSVNVDEFRVGNLGTYSFTGQLDVDRLHNTAATMAITSLATVNDTLYLDAGSISLNAGADLNIASNAWIRVDNGSLTLNGGVLTDTLTYHVLYVGGNYTTGIEAAGSGLTDVTLMMNDSTTTLTLGGDLEVNGTLEITRGRLILNGRDLMLKGDFKASVGNTISGNAASSVFILTTNSLTNDLEFTPGAAVLAQLEADIFGGTVNLKSDLQINDSLKLRRGNLNLTGTNTLTMAAGSMIRVDDGALVLNSGNFNGMAAYSLWYGGGSMNAGAEITGSGLNNLTLDLNTTTASITATQDVMVAGTLDLMQGILNLNGMNLQVSGDLAAGGSGTISGNSGSDIAITTGSMVSGKLNFTPGNETIGTFTLDLGTNNILELGTAMIVSTELDMQSGLLKIVNEDLIIGAAATVSGGADNSYVWTAGSGGLVMQVNAGMTKVMYHVGTDISYSPASVQQNAGAGTDMFRVRVDNGVWSEGTTGYDLATTTSVVDRTWFVNPISSSTSIDMNMELHWNSGIEANGFDRTNAYISNYVNGDWDLDAAASAGNTSGSYYMLNRSSLTSTGAFSVQDTATVVGVEEALFAKDIEIYPNPSSGAFYVQLPVAHATGKVVDATGKLRMEIELQSGANAVDLTSLPAGIYFLLIEDQDGHQATRKVVLY